MSAPLPLAAADSATATDSPWRRLDSRMIWVDVARTAVSLVPAVLAVGVFGVQPTWSELWPFVLIAVGGVVGAADDALRWVKTRYRITDTYVERRTGLLVGEYRSIRRDRIRSVDTKAKLRHRLAGLRLVTIGAGQQAAAGEAALRLDAVSTRTAEELRHRLLSPSAETAPAATGDHGDETAAEHTYATFRWSWLAYNSVHIWAFVVAAGLLWGGYWFTRAAGFDSGAFVAGLLDWERLGWGWTVLIAVSVSGAIGVVGLAAYFVAESWGFRLCRIWRDGGSVLRTSQGLFTTRVVTRDDRRLRGVGIGEPLFWRWMRAADTEVISTGLAAATVSETGASTILPRCPRAEALRVAADVLGDPRPLRAQLRRHPRAALRRRVLWAVSWSCVLTGLLGVLSTVVPAVPGWVWFLGAGVLPLGLTVALVGYRALGHAAVGGYLVVRFGVLSRRTAVLQRRAVIGWTFRQSILQRRLGLLSVAASTAAGVGSYGVSDADATEVVAFADAAVPGLLRPFLGAEHEDAPC